MDRIRDRLAQDPGVESVETRGKTGSVVVHYEPSQLSLDGLLAMLYEAGVVVHGMLAGEEIGPGPTGDGRSTGGAGTSRTAGSIIEAVQDLDHRISEMTGQKLDLKTLFPLTLGAIGVRRLLQSGLGLAEIPTYVLLWYAFDAFYKLHRDTQAAPPSPRPVDDNSVPITGDC
jgi:hypothetical protein